MLWLGLSMAAGVVRQQLPAYAVSRLSGVTIPGLPPVTGHICVDQFGYLPEGDKVAVINDPQIGYNAGDHYVPSRMLIIRTRTGKSVTTGLVVPWQSGAVHADSGDRGWWFDFSALKTPGEYYLYDPQNKVRSPLFRVGNKVFNPILRAATRMFAYQRIGQAIPPKVALGPWTDAAAFPQDAHARYVNAKSDPKTERDMSGGWMDAGDTDKYPPFLGDVIHPLLYAYRANPRVFTDDDHIVESGNGLPDILDEVKYELDWLVRSQAPDGSLPVKMGNVDYNGAYPLARDVRPRYYGPADTGATIYTDAATGTLTLTGSSTEAASIADRTCPDVRR
jgi:hypothetical protein